MFLFKSTVLMIDDFLYICLLIFETTLTKIGLSYRSQVHIKEELGNSLKRKSTDVHFKKAQTSHAVLTKGITYNYLISTPTTSKFIFKKLQGQNLKNRQQLP